MFNTAWHGRETNALFTLAAITPPLANPEITDGQIELLAIHWTDRQTESEDAIKSEADILTLSFCSFQSRANMNMKYFLSFHWKSPNGISK